MKAVLIFVFGVFTLQNTYAQCIGTAPVIAPITQTNSVGVKLADTLSLLTVSSLLAEKLPFDYPCGCSTCIPPWDSPYCPWEPSCCPWDPPCGPWNPPCCPWNPPCGPYYQTYAPVEITPIVNTCGCGYNGYSYPYNTNCLY